MKLSTVKYLAWLPIILAAASFSTQSMFSNEGTLGYDGFFLQIQSVVEATAFARGFGFEDGAQLALNHALRFAVVSPFFFLWTNGAGNQAEFLLIYLYALPVYLSCVGGFKFRYGASLLIPLIVSPRSYLVALGILALFNAIHSQRRMGGLLFYSVILVNLSSGVTLAWLLTVYLNRDRLFGRYPWLKYIIALAACLFTFSLIHKYQFVSGGTSDAESNRGLIALLERNIFFDSLESGRISRFIGYAGLLLFVVFFSVYNYFIRKRSRVWFISFLPIFPLFLVEGLGVMSYAALLMCVIFGLGKRIELKAQRAKQEARKLRQANLLARENQALLRNEN